MRSTLDLGSDQRNWKFYVREGLVLATVVVAVALLWLSMHAS